MNAKAFLTTALTQALELGIATPDDVLRHTGPELLAQHLPRALWSRLLAACLGSPKVDARLVVETVGVANLVEHLPAATIWACVSELATRALGGAVSAAPRPVASAAPVAPAPKLESKPILAPPPPEEPKRPSAPPPPPPGPSIPTSVRSSSPSIPITPDPEAEERPTPLPSRARTPTSQRFRQSGTGIGRLAGTTSAPASTPPPPAASSSAAVRRPQAQAGAPVPDGDLASVRRGATESESFDIETQVGGDGADGADDWKSSLAVDDEQLVDWTSDDPPARR